jgi:glycogen(starch) synthase
MLKLLLVGPFPPPHGGVSVHVLTLQDLLLKSGITCLVLNLSCGAPRSDRYVSGQGRLHFLFLLLRYSFRGWAFHVHINGHNAKSWMVALAAGLAGVVGRRDRAATLTVHSGMAPSYLDSGRLAACVAWGASVFYRHIVAVNSEIGDALRRLPVPENRIEILPAFLPTPATLAPLPNGFEEWTQAHDPVLSTALWFRPEYGFELLVQALAELRKKHPRLGCVVMGDSPSRPRGLPQYIHAIGDVPHESCLAVIARSNAFVRPTFADGDAISVREAIALGTPVVASDVVDRPAEALCFKTGDPGDLASKLDSLLSGPRPRRHCGLRPGENRIHRLLELYS